MKRIKAILAEPKILSLLDQAIVSGGNFITLIYLARHLNTEDYGFFSLAMLAVLFLSNLHRAIVTRPLDVMGAGEKPEIVLGRLIVLFKSLWLLIPVSLAILAGLSNIFFPDWSLLASCSLYLLAFFLQEMMRRYWYTIKHMHHALRSDFISYGGQVAMLILVTLYWDITTSLAFLILALTSFAAFLIDLMTLGKSHPVEKPPLAELMQQHWKFSKWLILSVFAIWSAGQIYPLLIAPLGAVAVAMFAACGNIMRIVSLVIQAVDNYLPLRAASLLKEEGIRAFQRHMNQTLFFSLLAGSAFSIAIYFYSYEILHIVYAGNYDNAVNVLRLMLPGALFTLLGMVLGSYSLALSDPRASFLANLAATTCTLTVGLWCIMKYGVVGAAAASSLTAASAMIAQGIFVFLKLRQLSSKDIHISGKNKRPHTEHA